MTLAKRLIGFAPNIRESPVALAGRSKGVVSLNSGTPYEEELHRDTVDYGRRIRRVSSTSNADLKAIDRLFVRPMYRTGLRQYLVDLSLVVGSTLSGAAVKLWYPSGSPSSITFTNVVEGDYSRTGGINPGDPNSTKTASSGVLASTLSNTDTHIAYYALATSAGGNSGREIQNQNFNAGSLELIITFSGGSIGSYLRIGGVNTVIENVNPSAVTGLFIGSKIGTDGYISRQGSIYATNNASTPGSPLTATEITIFSAVVGSIRPCVGYSFGRGIPSNLQNAYWQIWQQTMQYFGRAT